MNWPSSGSERGELAASSERDNVSPKLCTPYMLSFMSPGSSIAGSGSSSEACGLRDRKKVVGAAVRGSRDGEGWSKDGLGGKVGKSGTGRIVKTSRRFKVDFKKV
jgi:hypothetical protein